jgi:hypothetical protein
MLSKILTELHGFLVSPRKPILFRGKRGFSTTPMDNLVDSFLAGKAQRLFLLLSCWNDQFLDSDESQR